MKPKNRAMTGRLPGSPHDKSKRDAKKPRLAAMKTLTTSSVFSGGKSLNPSTKGPMKKSSGEMMTRKNTRAARPGRKGIAASANTAIAE